MKILTAIQNTELKAVPTIMPMKTGLSLRYTGTPPSRMTSVLQNQPSVIESRKTRIG